MKTNTREVLVFYNPESSEDRKTVAYAHTLSRHVKAYNYASASTTEMNWRSLITNLRVHPKDLFNKAHPDYQQSIRGREFDDEGWLNILVRNPHLIRKPIAICGRRVVLCNTPTDIYRIG